MHYYGTLMFGVLAELSEVAAAEFREKLCTRYHCDVQAEWREIAAITTT